MFFAVWNEFHSCSNLRLVFDWKKISKTAVFVPLVPWRLGHCGCKELQVSICQIYRWFIVCNLKSQNILSFGLLAWQIRHLKMQEVVLDVFLCLQPFKETNNLSVDRENNHQLHLYCDTWADKSGIRRARQ